MIKINYESDFKLIETTEEQRFADVPFEFVYATNSGTYTASYDGEAYTNCKRNEDGSITIIFNKHGLGVGKLKVRREFFVPDRDFPDGVYNVVSNDTTDVILVEGKTEGFDVENSFRPPYITDGEGGGEIVSVEIVDNLESDAPDKALSARQGKELKGMIPTQVSELENDEGYITEDDVSEAVSGKQDALTLTVKDNGNIVIGNISGQSKEFMPATPSGDPMHYAYLAVGAKWNDTDSDIVKTGILGQEVIHKSKRYLLNDVGDLTADDMQYIYANIYGIYFTAKARVFQADAKLRTLIGGPYFAGQVLPVSAMYAFYSSNIVSAYWTKPIHYTSQAPNSDIHVSISDQNSKYELFGYAKRLKYVQELLCGQLKESIKIFKGCTSLEETRMAWIKTDLLFAESPNISKASILYSVQYAQPTQAITITLHADAYARLVDDADIVAALEAQPLVTLVSA